MSLKRLTFTVYLDDPEHPDAEPVEHLVEVRSVDQLKAELEGKRQGVSLEDKMHTTHLWVWAAMTRTHAYEGKFRDFVERCVAVGDPDEADISDVDPTRPAASPDSA